MLCMAAGPEPWAGGWSCSCCWAAACVQQPCRQQAEKRPTDGCTHAQPKAPQRSLPAPVSTSPHASTDVQPAAPRPATRLLAQLLRLLRRRKQVVLAQEALQLRVRDLLPHRALKHALRAGPSRAERAWLPGGSR